MLRLALEPFEDETWGGAFGSTAEDCERLRSLLLVEVAKGLSEGPADGAGSPAGDDDEALCAYCGGEGRGVPVNWVVDVADHALTWFLGTAFEYLERDRANPSLPDGAITCFRHLSTHKQTNEHAHTKYICRADDCPV